VIHAPRARATFGQNAGPECAASRRSSPPSVPAWPIDIGRTVPPTNYPGSLGRAVAAAPATEAPVSQIPRGCRPAHDGIYGRV
jgi:hypothetical protein